MTRVFSGIQPTGALHLGNHLGAVRNWVTMQAETDATFCIVDLHAITMPHDPAELRRNTVDLATGLLAIGLDPEQCTLFVQSHVTAHAQLAWLLNCITGFGELKKMPQFKDKSDKLDAEGGGHVPVGLFDYPVLQTADIILYNAEEVPVGEDQRHHIELARDIAGRFNHRFGDTFVLPKAVMPAAGARVMDLQDPTSKMSKSTSSEKGIINLLDEPGRIEKKIKSAMTDSDPVVRYDREEKAGVSNLLDIFSAATGRPVDDLATEYADGGYGNFKGAVAEAVIAMLEPIQKRHHDLAQDPGEVERLLTVGADKARAVAEPVLEKAYTAMGFWRP